MWPLQLLDEASGLFTPVLAFCHCNRYLRQPTYKDKRLVLAQFYMASLPIMVGCTWRSKTIHLRARIQKKEVETPWFLLPLRGQAPPNDPPPINTMLGTQSLTHRPLGDSLDPNYHSIQYGL
jgi:hypothetical protein